MSVSVKGCLVLGPRGLDGQRLVDLDYARLCGLECVMFPSYKRMALRLRGAFRESVLVSVLVLLAAAS